MKNKSIRRFLCAVAAASLLWTSPVHAEELHQTGYEDAYTVYYENHIEVKSVLKNIVYFDARITNDIVYITGDFVNVRILPSTNTQVMRIYNQNEPIERVATSDAGWDLVICNGDLGYIWNEYVSEIPMQGPTAADIRLMSSIIFAEAGNQCLAGKQAVGIVVINRVKSEKYPNSIFDVIYQPGQFSPTFNGSLNSALKMYDNGKMSQECIDAALYALDHNTLVCYNDIMYDLSSYLYFNQYMSNAKLRIQDHVFK